MNTRIRRVRKDAKLSQTQFGQTLAVSQFTITSYETGKSTPDNAMIKLICSTYNVNEEWLRTGVGDPYKKQLLPALQRILRSNPALHELMLNAVDKLTLDDWRLIDSSLSKLINNN